MGVRAADVGHALFLVGVAEASFGLALPVEAGATGTPGVLAVLGPDVDHVGFFVGGTEASTGLALPVEAGATGTPDVLAALVNNVDHADLLMGGTETVAGLALPVEEGASRTPGVSAASVGAQHVKVTLEEWMTMCLSIRPYQDMHVSVPLQIEWCRYR